MADFINVESPAEYYPNPDIGRPIFNGQIYIGLVDEDPEIPANQIDVYALQENGTRVQIAQPINMGAGGVPVDNLGTPYIRLQVEDKYSIKVFDLQNGAPVQKYYIPDNSNGNPLFTAIELIDELKGDFVYVSDTVADLKNLVVDSSMIDAISYNSERKSRFILRSGVAPEPGDYGYIQSNTTGYYWEYHERVIDVKGFGALGDRINDDTAAIQAALNATRLLPYPIVLAVYIPAGTYRITSSLIVPGYSNIYGDGYYSILEVDSNLAPGTVLNVLTVTENGANGIHIRDLAIWGQNNLQPNNPDVSAISIEPPLAVSIYNLFENLYIKEMSSSAVKISGAGMDNSSFTNCMFRDSKGDAAVHSTSMNRVDFIGCRIRSGKDGVCHGILMDGANNRYNSVRDCRIDDNSGYGVVCTNGAISSSIENNNFVSNDLGGVLIDLSDNCIILGNQFTSHLQTIFLDRSNSCTISDNNAWDCNGDGIKLNASDSCTIISNNITGGTANAGAGVIMDVSDNCIVNSNSLTNIRGSGVVNISGNRCSITSNKIFKAGQQASNTYFGIVFEGTASFNTAFSNYISSDAAPNLSYSISNGGAGCQENFIAGNRLSDGISGDVVDTGTNTSVGVTGSFDLGTSTLTSINGLVTNIT